MLLNFYFFYLGCTNEILILGSVVFGAVCGFNCCSPISSSCNLVCGDWPLHASNLSLFLLLSERKLWLLSNCLCTFTYLTLIIYDCCNVNISSFFSTCFFLTFNTGFFVRAHVDIPFPASALVLLFFTPDKENFRIQPQIY